MKIYVITTGVIFALVTVVHLWRAVAEGPDLASDPGFILATIVPAAFTAWAWRVFRQMPRS
jgi:hypothetical protein